MATKSQKTKTPDKVSKKATEKLEISLRKKIKDFVLSLGHDAEEIGDEIKKTSKILAKRLNRKLNEAKSTINEKVTKVKKAKKDDTKADKVLVKAKKEAKKLANKAVSAKNVNVVSAIKKQAKKATGTKTDPAAAKKKAPAKANSSKPVAKKKVEAKAPPIANEENAHPETPTPNKRQTANRIPKSDTKPHNTDLPLEAGPRNKYKRG